MMSREFVHQKDLHILRKLFGKLTKVYWDEGR